MKRFMMVFLFVIGLSIVLGSVGATIYGNVTQKGSGGGFWRRLTLTSMILGYERGSQCYYTEASGRQCPYVPGISYKPKDPAIFGFLVKHVHEPVEWMLGLALMFCAIRIRDSLNTGKIFKTKDI